MVKKAFMLTMIVAAMVFLSFSITGIADGDMGSGAGAGGL